MMWKGAETLNRKKVLRDYEMVRGKGEGRRWMGCVEINVALWCRADTL